MVGHAWDGRTKGASAPAPNRLPGTERKRKPLGEALGRTEINHSLQWVPGRACSSSRAASPQLVVGEPLISGVCSLRGAGWLLGETSQFGCRAQRSSPVELISPWL